MTGPFDQRNASEQTRDALTQSMKNKIKGLFKKCEYCGKIKPISLLAVHHIIQVSSASGSRDLNIPSNLIVLCLDHHRKGDLGEITKTALKKKTRIRSDKKKSELKNILKNRDQISDKNSILKVKPPRIKPPTFQQLTFKPLKFWV